MPVKTESIKTEETRIIDEYCSSDTTESIEEYLLKNGSSELVDYYLKTKAYKEKEHSKGCIVN